MGDITNTPHSDLDAFTCRGLDSLYRERASRARLGCWLRDPYSRQLDRAIEKLEHYGKLRRMGGLRSPDPACGRREARDG